MLVESTNVPPFHGDNGHGRLLFEFTRGDGGHVDGGYSTAATIRFGIVVVVLGFD